MYYALLLIAAALFSTQIVFYTKYQKAAGHSLLSALRFSFWYGLVSFAASWAASGGRIEATAFSIVLATIYALILVAFSYVSVKVLSCANIAVYSMFTMLGGMLIPAAAGIAIWGEELGMAKVVCCLFVTAALLVNLPKGKSSRSAVKYYILAFVLNGAASVVFKWHQSGGESSVSSQGFIVLYSAFTAMLALGLLVLLRLRPSEAANEALPEQRHEGICFFLGPRIALLFVLGYGVFNWGGQLLVLVSLLHLHASVQFPMLTGAVITMSTIASFIIGEKPGKRTVFAMALAVIGMVVLMAGG